MQEETRSVEASDHRISSSLSSIRTPSPSFISIESRKVDPPLTVTPSPPPPRRSHTPMSACSRATPSPTLSRSEKLMKITDPKPAVTPPPPAAVGELASDELGPVDVAGMVDSMTTVRDKKSFFEEAQKAEVNKTYVRKDPIDIPERLGPDAEEDAPAAASEDVLKDHTPRVDLSKLVNHFEAPQAMVYTRKEPIVISERLGSDSEDAEADAQPLRAEEISSFNVKAIKNVFETGEHGSQAARELREQIERREPEVTSISEQVCSDFGNTTMMSEMHCRGNPPSYADVVRGSVPTEPADASAEELLRSFQQSWAESQDVFSSFSVTTSQRTCQVVTQRQETLATESVCSRGGAVSGVSEEGVSHGGAGRRQTQLP